MPKWLAGFGALSSLGGSFVVLFFISSFVQIKRSPRDPGESLGKPIFYLLVALDIILVVFSIPQSDQQSSWFPSAFPEALLVTLGRPKGEKVLPYALQNVGFLNNRLWRFGADFFMIFNAIWRSLWEHFHFVFWNFRCGGWCIREAKKKPRLIQMDDFGQPWGCFPL